MSLNEDYVCRLEAQITNLKAALETSRANEAVCHCGSLVTQHTQSDNHGAVERPYPCQFATLLRDAPCTCPTKETEDDGPIEDHEPNNPACFHNQAKKLLAGLE